MKHIVDKVNHHLRERASDASEPDVLEAIHAVMHRVRSRMHREMRDGAHALTRMDARVLAFFAEHPGAGQRELVAQSGRDKGQIARLIAGLRERGLLEASPDELDRRSVRLQLTAEGRTIHEGLHQLREAMSARAVSGLDAAERAQLVALLARVGANLDLGDGAAAAAQDCPTSRQGIQT